MLAYEDFRPEAPRVPELGLDGGERPYEAGHAAVVIYWADSTDAGAVIHTKYFEYGRYSGLNPEKYGNARRKSIPDLRVGTDGGPSRDSIHHLMRHLSRKHQGSDILATVNSLTEQGQQRAEAFANEASQNEGVFMAESYDVAFHNCASFVEETARKGGVILADLSNIETPESIVQAPVFGTSLFYDRQTDALFTSRSEFDKTEEEEAPKSADTYKMLQRLWNAARAMTE